jgi:hypothetical protein
LPGDQPGKERKEMQVKVFAHAREGTINEWLTDNIGRGTGPNDHGKQVKFITQSSAGVTHDEGNFIVEEITLCIWYD